MSMILIINPNKTSCSWSEWLDLWIEQLKNIYGPIVKEHVQHCGPYERFRVRVTRKMSFFQPIPSLGRKPHVSSKMNVVAKQSILSFQ
jgi:hypothetical protein